MIKKIILICMITLPLCGCYDKVDIEDIKSISLICVDNNSIYYCAVTTEAQEKKYGFQVFDIQTDDLYYGINSISEQTGKDVSLSHLEAIMFSDDCNYELIKKNLNSLLEGTNSHPKVMTAFYNGDFERFFKNINIPTDTSVNKLIDNVFGNKYEKITQCTAMDLSCAMNFNISGKSVPLIYLDSDGNIQSHDSIFVNNIDTVYLDDKLTALLNIIDDNKSQVYINHDNIVIPIGCENIKYDMDNERIDIILNVKSHINDELRQAITDYSSHVVSEIINKKNMGFDLLNMQHQMTKKFRDIPTWNKYIEDKDGIDNWLKSLNITVAIG